MLSGIWKKRSLKGLVIIFILSVLKSSLALAQTPGTLKWEYQPGESLFGFPSMGADGTIYVVGYRNLFAINPDGTEKWRFRTLYGTIPVSSAIGANGTIYFQDENSELYAINPDGTEKWHIHTRLRTCSPSIGADGTIYLSSTSRLLAVNPDGTVKWEFQTELSSEDPNYASIGADGTIYFCSGDDKLYAVNPDGTEKWHLEAGYVTYPPSIGADGTIYFSSWDGKLYAVNPDGTVKWEFQTGHCCYTSPSMGADGTIYFCSGDQRLYAINPNGTEKWSFLTGDQIGCSPAIGADGTIYFTSRDERLYAINPDGTEKWSFLTGDRFALSLTIGADGTIYSVFGYRLNAIYSDSYGLADSSWPMFQHDARNTRRVIKRENLVIPLTLDEAYRGTIQPWLYNYLSLDTEAGRSLLVEVVPQANINSLILDGKLAQVRQKNLRVHIWRGFGRVYGHYLFYDDRLSGQGRIGQPQPVVDHLMLHFGSAA
jgi:outer membrane protein assembly factor BamB